MSNNVIYRYIEWAEENINQRPKLIVKDKTLLTLSIDVRDEEFALLFVKIK